MSLSGVFDIDLEILNHLSNDMLTKIQCINKEITKTSQIIWLHRLKRDYPCSLDYKPDYMSYCNWYNELDKDLQGHIAALEYRLSRRQKITPEDMVYIGREDGLELLSDLGHLPEPYDVRTAISRGNKHIVEWMYKHCLLDTNTLKTAANISISNNKIEIAELIEGYGYLPDSVGADWTCGSGSLNSLKWLYERGIYPSSNSADYAADNGHLEILDWLYKTFKFTPTSAGRTG
jgi:hypothetical protein